MDLNIKCKRQNFLCTSKDLHEKAFIARAPQRPSVTHSYFI